MKVTNKIFIIKKTRVVSLLFSFIILHAWHLSAQDPGLKLHYSFDKAPVDNTQVTDDSGNGYAGKLANGAKVRKMGTYPVLDLGAANGYLNLESKTGQLISTLDDFSISVYLYVARPVNLGSNGNFIWTFANSDNIATTANGSMFFSAKGTRFAISKKNWTDESSVNSDITLTKGSWQHITYTQAGYTGTIYVNGVQIKTGTVSNKPSDLGNTTHNYLGKSCYNGDAYLQNTLIRDFRIYNKALTPAQVLNLADNIPALNDALATELLAKEKEALILKNPDKVSADIKLPSDANGVAIAWASSNENLISARGNVTRPAIDASSKTIKLTATLTLNGKSTTKEFAATVLPWYNEQTSVDRDAADIVIPGNLANLRTNLKLPGKGSEGSIISWQSDKVNYLSNTGAVVALSPKGAGKIKVTLTATVKKGARSTIKKFNIYIAEDEGFEAYLFAYFTGNGISEEALRWAVSNDGFNFRALNNNNPVLDSKAISSTGGIRDPHILRGADGKTYYMVATDMVSANGWSSNRAMILMKSANLIDWKTNVVNIQTTYPGYEDLQCVWAPQTIYDRAKGKYMIYWSMRKGSGADKVYYAYANADFTALESAPRLLFENPNGKATIDADIIEKDGTFHLFLKTETGEAGIIKALSDNLTGGYVLLDKYLDQSDAPVEGSGVFKLINSDSYVLMYDMYTTGKYQFTTSTDLLNFAIQPGTSMNFNPRHGTVIPITKAEAETLARKWAKPSDIQIQSSVSPQVRKNNIVIDEKNKTVFLPVKRGTDLKNLKPQLTSLPGAAITPTTAQNFTSGAVNYTVGIAGVGSNTYSVKAEVNNNPALDGYYADPEILYSHKTGKYYIYPTSDGFDGWSGKYFKTFSSGNLADWKDEGIILNLPTDVSWASTNAWAPAIAEKKINGNYQYFYYFCAAQKVGVAVANEPTGPFIDSGKPLISTLPSGVSGGQQIDPDVFTDPVSGTSYIYWGNGYMACAELNADMISIKPNTTKIITPDNTYREGTEVFYKDGKYYFMWSEDDTRSPEYKVRYATSTSPTGPLVIPANNLVIAKDASRGIYGTGHNCVIHTAEGNKWFIIYHRFTRPHGITMGDAAGYNREVCIDELKFNPDGSIIQVQPTNGGIAPIK